FSLMITNSAVLSLISSLQGYLKPDRGTGASGEVDGHESSEPQRLPVSKWKRADRSEGAERVEKVEGAGREV
ncbi:MAG: hypothetical protein WBK88_07770, partial [Methanothrix sp.]